MLGGVLFLPPSRPFHENELIIQNPLSTREFNNDTCIAYAGKCTKFMQNGIWMTNGEPNPVSFDGKKLDDDYKHYDYILPVDFINAIKFLKRVDLESYFDTCMVDDGSFTMLERCNQIIRRAQIRSIELVSDTTKTNIRDQLDEILRLDTFIECYRDRYHNTIPVLPKMKLPFKYTHTLYRA